MILEAFSTTLHQDFAAGQGTAIDILHQWLNQQLEKELEEDTVDPVQCVIKAEIEPLVSPDDMLVGFVGRSPSGNVLLKTLYDYCRSYEDWQYRRWLHQVNASDFQAAP